MAKKKKKKSQLASVWGRLRKNKMAVIGLVMLLVILLSAALADVLFDYETMAVQQNASMRLNPPSSEHLLGTDEVGRDILARIVFGARVSLPVAMATIFFAAIIGGMLGALSGYGSKRLTIS